MNSNKLRALLALMILSVGAAWNATGRPEGNSATRPAHAEASGMVDDTAQVQTEATIPHTAILTKMTGTNLSQLPLEPQFVVGTNTLVTGLAVDLLQPKQTWKMLNPAAPAKDLSKTITVTPPVVALNTINGNLAVHDADFAVLRFGLGSTPKPTKTEP
jgi:hypothetical protein